MTEESESCDVLVLGAGIAGLAAATSLAAGGKRVIVVDKARGVGGRMATRRLAEGQADHGVQYFTANSPEFLDEVRRWQDTGAATPWSAQGDSVRYIGHPSMTAPAKLLAKSLAVRLGKKIVYLSALPSAGPGSPVRWFVASDDGMTYEADALIATLPVPQTLSLFGESKISLKQPDRATLSAISYWPSFALLLRYDETPQFPSCGYLEFPDGPIAWVAQNRTKGITDATTVTVHARDSFSREHFEDPVAGVISLLQERLRDWLPTESLESQMHRWRFAKVERAHPDPFLRLEGHPPLYCAGDAFGAGGRVETAWLSGRAAAAALREELR